MNSRLLALALLAAGCGHARKPAPSPPAPRGTTTVKVDNQNFLDMDIYVLSDGARFRLGMVRGLSTETFTIPDDIVRISPQVRFELHPIGGRANPRTETITVMPGDHLALTIPPR
jgi:hypothetical protein